jgi:hypothetical protein
MPHVVNFRQGHAASNLRVRSPQDAQSSSVFSASADTSVTTAQSTANPYVTEIVHHAAGTTVALAVIVAILAVIIIVGECLPLFESGKDRLSVARFLLPLALSSDSSRIRHILTWAASKALSFSDLS